MAKIAKQSRKGGAALPVLITVGVTLQANANGTGEYGPAATHTLVLPLDTIGAVEGCAQRAQAGDQEAKPWMHAQVFWASGSPAQPHVEHDALNRSWTR